MSESTKLTIIVSANILVLLLALGIIAVVVAVSNFSVGQALAQTSLSSSPISTAKMHIDEAIKALQNGDTKGALTHLNIADKVLGSIVQ